MPVRHGKPLKKTAVRQLKKAVQVFAQLYPEEGRPFIQAERKLESDNQVWHHHAHTSHALLCNRARQTITTHDAGQ